MLSQEYEMTDQSRGTMDAGSLPPLDKETRYIMKSELRTGLGLSSIYYAFILFIPIINWYMKDFAFSQFWGGMSVTWFLTTVVGMAMAFLIAYIHTKRYEKRLARYDAFSSPSEEQGNSRGGNSA
ncbi:hypothetical protein [Pseudobacillus badius]|uniref:hypothetical protein n=1 Tax=Bacillus badius TaxID=1455 RepID=UPI0005ADF024|nr:hypothetical protein [Bacillus badius]KIL73350.1 hypothetical protein SD78_3538 [Bacillus badius]KZR56752.1 hypothetical protein A3781_05680 [Bacillus badius]